MPRQGLLVLLVEDTPDTLDAFAHFLRTAGFRVETAVDGRQAVDKARSLRPDVVVMDLALPELDGWEATHQIKSDPATRDTPVIAFTGHAFQQSKESARQAGCDAFLTKPLDPASLVTEIHLNEPQVLYRHWEHEQWNPWEIDLTRDESNSRTSSSRMRRASKEVPEPGLT